MNANRIVMSLSCIKRSGLNEDVVKFVPEKHATHEVTDTIDVTSKLTANDEHDNRLTIYCC